MAGEPRSPAIPLLSACLIVRDEAELLPDCLASLAGVADELVVVDTGSTDATPEIARQAGARLSHFQWCDDFAAARNAALDQAHGRWVLQIDADQRLVGPGGGPLDKAGLRHWLAAPPPPALGLDALLLTDRQMLGHAGQEAMAVPRLFPRRPERRYVGRIHETILDPGRSWKVAQLGGVELLHLGYSAEVVASRRKRERNLRLCELSVRERPDDAAIHYYYGNELALAGRRAEALVHLREAWNRMPAWATDSGLWWLTIVALGEGLNVCGHHEEVLAWVTPLLQRFPGVAHLQFLRGDALRLLGRPEEALICLQAALGLPPAGVAWEPWNTRCYCLNAIGVIHEQAGRLDLAIEAYRQSLRLGPSQCARTRLAALEPRIVRGDAG